MSKILLKNALLVTPERIIRNDLLIEDQYITKIAKDICTSADLIIDCHDIIVMPGLIDDHVHFREPGMEQKATIFSESRAAVLGGVTSYLDMPNNSPSTTSIELVNNKKNIAKKDSLANYGFYLGASDDNLDEIVNAPVNEIAGIKVFMGSSTGNLLVDKANLLEQIFANSKTIIALHCEDTATIVKNEKRVKEQYKDNVPFSLHPFIRNTDCCLNSTRLAVEIAKRTGARIHIMHVSTKEEIKVLRSLKFGNAVTRQISAEACIPHLFFSEADYQLKKQKIKCNPAIKTEADRAAVVKAVEEGILTTIGTDHAPHEWTAKSDQYFKCASGMPSVQFSLLCLLDLWKRKELTLETIVKAASENVADRFHIHKRGRLEEGYFADIAIVDPNKNTFVNKDSVASLCKWSPFEGYTFSCAVTHTIVNGRLIVREGVICDETPAMALVFDR